MKTTTPAAATTRTNDMMNVDDVVGSPCPSWVLLRMVMLLMLLLQVIVRISPLAPLPIASAANAATTTTAASATTSTGTRTRTGTGTASIFTSANDHASWAKYDDDDDDTTTTTTVKITATTTALPSSSSSSSSASSSSTRRKMMEESSSSSYSSSSSSSSSSFLPKDLSSRTAALFETYILMNVLTTPSSLLLPVLPTDNDGDGDDENDENEQQQKTNDIYYHPTTILLEQTLALTYQILSLEDDERCGRDSYLQPDSQFLFIESARLVKSTSTATSTMSTMSTTFDYPLNYTYLFRTRALASLNCRNFTTIQEGTPELFFLVEDIKDNYHDDDDHNDTGSNNNSTENEYDEYDDNVDFDEANNTTAYGDGGYQATSSENENSSNNSSSSSNNYCDCKIGPTQAAFMELFQTILLQQQQQQHQQLPLQVDASSSTSTSTSGGTTRRHRRRRRQRQLRRRTEQQASTGTGTGTGTGTTTSFPVFPVALDRTDADSSSSSTTTTTTSTTATTTTTGDTPSTTSTTTTSNGSASSPSSTESSSSASSTSSINTRASPNTTISFPQEEEEEDEPEPEDEPGDEPEQEPEDQPIKPPPAIQQIWSITQVDIAPECAASSSSSSSPSSTTTTTTTTSTQPQEEPTTVFTAKLVLTISYNNNMTMMTTTTTTTTRSLLEQRFMEVYNQINLLNPQICDPLHRLVTGVSIQFPKVTNDDHDDDDDDECPSTEPPPPLVYSSDSPSSAPTSTSTATTTYEDEDEDDEAKRRRRRLHATTAPTSTMAPSSSMSSSSSSSSQSPSPSRAPTIGSATTTLDLFTTVTGTCIGCDPLQTLFHDGTSMMATTNMGTNDQSGSTTRSIFNNHNTSPLNCLCPNVDAISEGQKRGPSVEEFQEFFDQSSVAIMTTEESTSASSSASSSSSFLMPLLLCVVELNPVPVGCPNGNVDTNVVDDDDALDGAYQYFRSKLTITMSLKASSWNRLLTCPPSDDEEDEDGNDDILQALARKKSSQDDSKDDHLDPSIQALEELFLSSYNGLLAEYCDPVGRVLVYSELLDSDKFLDKLQKKVDKKLTKQEGDDHVEIKALFLTVRRCRRGLVPDGQDAATTTTADLDDDDGEEEEETLCDGLFWDTITDENVYEVERSMTHRKRSFEVDDDDDGIRLRHLRYEHLEDGEYVDDLKQPQQRFVIPSPATKRTRRFQSSTPIRGDDDDENLPNPRLVSRRGLLVSPPCDLNQCYCPSDAIARRPPKLEDFESVFTEMVEYATSLDEDSQEGGGNCTNPFSTATAWTNFTTSRTTSTSMSSIGGICPWRSNPEPFYTLNPTTTPTKVPTVSPTPKKPVPESIVFPSHRL